MSTWAASPDLRAIADALDPRLRTAFLDDVQRAHRAPAPVLADRVVLVGHRAAGKTRLLPVLARLAGRDGVDLDARVEQDTGRTVRALFREGEPVFRAHEARVFRAITDPVVVAAGGGFFFHHAALLSSCTAVLVPVTFETYRERLLSDAERPRLRPQLTLEEEVRAVHAEREAVFARATTVPLASWVASLLRETL
ncbi:MAG: shikimate kinase [Deltaproteobacteria bacterium]|nr:shikimate kinase [Deltaproteobacteria bacterium]